MVGVWSKKRNGVIARNNVRSRRREKQEKGGGMREEWGIFIKRKKKVR
jgi:hypothetical protein